MKNSILVVMAVVCAGVAFWLWSRSTRPDYPDTPDTITIWMCDTCEARHALTAYDLHRWTQDPKRLRRDAGVPNPEATVFWCEPCRLFSVCRAIHCPQHDVWFCPQKSDGASRDCPACLKAAGG